ncbi:MAG: DNA-3-methyladenine glycosylase family protein [bacterium]
MSDPDWRTAEEHLCGADSRLRAVVERHGPCSLQPQEGGFVTLAESILGQQLSNQVAQVLRARFRQQFTDGLPTPEAVLEWEAPRFREIGFSRAKIGYVRALAEAFTSGGLSAEKLEALEDEALIHTLCCIKGIGRWTAEMYLIFALNRPDVLPLGDAAIKAALRSLYALPEEKWQDEASAKTEAWRPWRTVGCWYLWKLHGETARARKLSQRPPASP